MTREIVLDTETTGLDPQSGHRIIEIGCVELIDRIPTGQTFHRYINPERDVPQEASNISGIVSEFLHDKPKFDEIAQSFIDFIAGSTLVIHNASFDLKFINAEFDRINIDPITLEIVDTLKIARKKFPGSPASLDALCKKFKIDLSKRSKHGALLDAHLLTRVYLQLMGGTQMSIFQKVQAQVTVGNINYRAPRIHTATANELEQHKRFIGTIKNPLWLDCA